MIRTRFAPSPTGFLHVGGLRTALYSYLVARQGGGTFVLRIEDTDRERQVAEGTLNILKSLYWAGIIPDEGVKLDETSDPDEPAVVQEGDGGPYIQSERLAIYQEHARRLIELGHAYYCFCSPERLAQLREEQERRKLPSRYDRRCRNLEPAASLARVQGGEANVIRLAMPPEGLTTLSDLIRGEVRFENNLLDDPVILKSDGFPTYHLASVVDDYLMKITHVIRGEEWLPSAPKHLALYAAFGWEAPQFAHLPLILNPDKTKLSKRQGDVAVEDYRAKGYLPEALVNFIAFLGWNPGGERELFTLDELAKEFSLGKVSKGGAVFNSEKLNWYNREYLKRMPLTELLERARSWLHPVMPTTIQDEKWLEQVVALERERVTTLAELPATVKFVFELPEYPGELLVWKKSTREEMQKILPELNELLVSLDDSSWTKEILEKRVGEWREAKGYSTGSVLWPLRVALSGQQNSPGPFEIAAVLGPAESRRRLQQAIDKMR
ncbi:MAG: glutamate--tRNA ligase [Candidatus Magasanikbacteria bacterium]|nr:glutamate--tRNA ligase [Candidatus Magasanikbacteria bacterium]